MNGVLCAGNKEETNYVIIQLPLVCHSQIKCQIKVRGHSVCLMECELPAPESDSREGRLQKSKAWIPVCRNPLCAAHLTNVHKHKQTVFLPNDSGRRSWNKITTQKTLFYY